MTWAADLRRQGWCDGGALAVVAGEREVGLAWSGGSTRTAAPLPEVVTGLTPLRPRWTWWSARETAPALVAAGIRVRTCWDLGAVGRLVHGLRRDDPAAVWAAAAGLPEPDRAVRRRRRPARPRRPRRCARCGRTASSAGSG